MPFTYKLPVFNITANIWRASSSLLDPPDVITDAQLYFLSRNPLSVNPDDASDNQPTMLLRVPIGTDLQETDQVEAAAGDAWFYRCIWTDRVHRGFPNEYFVGVLVHPGAPPGFDSLITETGDTMISETGDTLIEE